MLNESLLFSHAYRAFYDIPFETVEITGPRMVLTMKLTTFAWNVWDGQRAVEVCSPKPPSVGYFFRNVVPFRGMIGTR